MAPRILVADDEHSLRLVIRNALEKRGAVCEEAVDGREALAKIAAESYDLLILDIRMPHKTGLEILETIQSGKKTIPVILMTAEDTVEHAIASMKKGAFDYLVKPFDLSELETIVDKALLDRKQKEAPENTVPGKRHIPSGPYQLVGESRAIREIYKLIGKVALKKVDILIDGESGTGKELVARAIHAASAHHNGPFVPVNMGAIPKDLMESQLFGHMKGSFTGALENHAGVFEQAGYGTLFLDEIGEMPLVLQTKILRVLQEREVTPVGALKSVPIHARIIAATNKNLEMQVRAGTFREDLYYRLHVIPVHLPPLRQRRNDIPVLAHYFIDKLSHELGCEPMKIHKKAMEQLCVYPWPGNVRELENLIKRVLVLSVGSSMTVEDVQPSLKTEGGPSFDDETLSLEEMVKKKLDIFLGQWDGRGMGILYSTVIQQVEKALIRACLQKKNFNQIQTAELLGINRNTLRKKIRELGIPIPKEER